jgi:hypothetical protein
METTSYKGTMWCDVIVDRWEDFIQGRCLWITGEGPCMSIIEVGPVISFDPETSIATTFNGHRWTIRFGKDRDQKYGELIKTCERLLN